MLGRQTVQRVMDRLGVLDEKSPPRSISLSAWLSSIVRVGVTRFRRWRTVRLRATR